MFKLLRAFKELTIKFKLRQVKNYITQYEDLKENYPTYFAKLLMSTLFSRHRVAELRLSEAGKKLEERVKPEPEIKPNYRVTYEALKRQAEATFVYPFEGKRDAQLRQSWDGMLKMLNLLLQKRRIISFGPTHPAAHGVLKMLVQFDAEAPIVNPLFGINLNKRELYFQQPVHFDPTDQISLIYDEVPFLYANKKDLNLSEPKNIGYIRKVFSHVMRKTVPSVGISSAVLDCGPWTLLFWKFEQLAKLQQFCKSASPVYMNSTAIIPGCKTTQFPLGFCKDLFEFPCRFIYTIEDIWDMFLERNSKRHDVEEEFKFDDSDGLRGVLCDRYFNKLKEMRTASEIINKSLTNMPNREMKEGSGKVAPMDHSEIIRSVEELINHFQSYNQPQSKTIQEKYMAHLAEHSIYGLKGVGWYMTSFPQYYPFWKSGNGGKADK